MNQNKPAASFASSASRNEKRKSKKRNTHGSNFNETTFEAGVHFGHQKLVAGNPL